MPLPGTEILIDDGVVRARVTAVRGGRVETRVEVGGLVSSGKGVNLPGIQLITFGTLPLTAD